MSKQHLERREMVLICTALAIWHDELQAMIALDASGPLPPLEAGELRRMHRDVSALLAKLRQPGAMPVH